MSPNLIRDSYRSGTTQADAALLVIDATAGEFETGFELGGQTREHTLLIRSLGEVFILLIGFPRITFSMFYDCCFCCIFAGINQLIVVINKMDNVLWSQQRFDEICQKLGSFLHQVGFKDAVCFVPCSGLTGTNLTEKPTDPSASWYTGPTLIDSIGTLPLNFF